MHSKHSPEFKDMGLDGDPTVVNRGTRGCGRATLLILKRDILPVLFIDARTYYGGERCESFFNGQGKSLFCLDAGPERDFGQQGAT